MNRKVLYILFALLEVTILSGCRSNNELEYSADPVENVEALWKIIDEKYCYVEEKNCSWTDIRNEYVRRAEALKTQDKDPYEYQIALFDLMSGMLDSLRDGHVNLYTPFDISSCSLWYEGYPSNYNASLVSQYLGDYRMAGSLRYNILVRENDSIGYVYIGSFSSSFSDTNMMWVARQMSGCKGMIIDVRQNGGGDLDLAEKLAGYFFPRDTAVGYWQHKTGTAHNAFSEPEEMIIRASEKVQWQRPVVVLTNRHSYSATNFFAMAMKNAPRCLLVGGKTGGGGGMPLSYELPIGWTVRFSSIRMMDREMRSIEEGIDPDRTVTLTSTDEDDLIEYGIRVIRDAYRKQPTIPTNSIYD